MGVSLPLTLPLAAGPEVVEPHGVYFDRGQRQLQLLRLQRGRRPHGLCGHPGNLPRPG